MKGNREQGIGNGCMALLSVSVCVCLWLTGLFRPAVAEDTNDGAKVLPIEIVSKAYTEEIPADSPDHPCWKDATPVTLNLIPQNVQEPKPADTSIRQLTVRSLHSQGAIAFLLEWEDATRDDGLRSDKFGDGVGVEFPLSTDSMPDYRMGNDDKPVYLMFWRAERQRARIGGASFHDENYPNAWTDAYAFEPKAVGYKLPAGAAEEKDRYLGSKAAGNPAIVGVAPVVEELSARSWVRLTVQSSQDAGGAGAWKNGRWRVVLTRPLKTADEEDVDFDGKSSWPVSFAAWDGGKQNAGPRKMVSEGWVQLKIAP